MTCIWRGWTSSLAGSTPLFSPPSPLLAPLHTRQVLKAKNYFLVSSVVYSDQELFVPDPDPTRMKEQMNKSFISNFRPVDSGLKYL